MRARRATSDAGLVVGIDLGTTYSAVARVDELGKPAVLPDRDGANVTPSVVFFDGEQPIVGTMAKRSALAAPLDTVQFVKRSMGDPSWRFETSAGTAYRPEEISALILKRLAQDAERAVGHGPVSGAVITVPAYFDDAPRRATIDAGTIAGLDVLRVLNEPTAAALAYGIDGRADGTLLVYDLGGGTFDVTALRIDGGSFTVLATHGDRNLGGFDFDNLLMQLINERFCAAGGPDLLDDPATEAALRDQAEIAKHSLTTVDRTLVTLSGGGFTTAVPVTRSEFEDVCSGLLGRTRDIAAMVVEDAGLSWPQLDRVLLAGGSTRMPMVRTMLEQQSGRPVSLSANPDEVVAHGAAIQADLLSNGTSGTGRAVRVQDVTSHGLGEVLYQGSRSHPVNKVIIPPNAPIPARGSNIAATIDEGQERLSLRITQGDGRDLEFVRIIGEQEVPIPTYDHSASFETSLVYDSNQVVSVELRDTTADKVLATFEIATVANMKEDAVHAAAIKTARLMID